MTQGCPLVGTKDESESKEEFSLLRALADDELQQLSMRTRPLLHTHKDLQFTHACTVAVGTPNTLSTLPPLVRAINVRAASRQSLEEAMQPTQDVIELNDKYLIGMQAFVESGTLQLEDKVFRSSTLRFGTYILPYCNKSARSSCNRGCEQDEMAHRLWQQQAKEVTLDMFAFFSFTPP